MFSVMVDVNWLATLFLLLFVIAPITANAKIVPHTIAILNTTAVPAVIIFVSPLK